MKTRFHNYLHFSRNERLGAFALLTLCVTAFSTPGIVQWLRPRTRTDFSEFEATIQAFRKSAGAMEGSIATCFDFDPNLATAADFKRLGLSEKVAQNICHYREKGGSFRKPEDFQKIWGLPAKDFARLLPYVRISIAKKEVGAFGHSPEQPEYFPFDPNTATEADFLKLGLPGRTIKSILNYRSKGGYFRKKEDLAKIYTLSETDYARLESYVTFSKTSASGESTPPNNYAKASFGSYKSTTATTSVNMNRATAEAWMSLPLIGERRAQQIINFREKLGGFSSIEQLAEMYGMPDSVYQRIKSQLTLETGTIHQINLNTVTLEALDAHPYISRKQAELIIAYRGQHGNYNNPEDILKIKAFTDIAWWDKVSPYLGVK